MTDHRSWQFEYAGLPDEGATEPPHIWIEIFGPEAVAEYPCLLDSGSSFSAFPLGVADELGVERDLLEPAQIRTVNGLKEVSHLQHPKLVGARLDDQYQVRLAPYFIPPEVVEDEAFESEYYILGRDFFLPLEITFRQQAETIVIRAVMTSAA